jgi:hypothetical protein
MVVPELGLEDIAGCVDDTSTTGELFEQRSILHSQVCDDPISDDQFIEPVIRNLLER